MRLGRRTDSAVTRGHRRRLRNPVRDPIGGKGPAYGSHRSRSCHAVVRRCCRAAAIVAGLARTLGATPDVPVLSPCHKGAVGAPRAVEPLIELRCTSSPRPRRPLPPRRCTDRLKPRLLSLAHQSPRSDPREDLGCLRNLAKPPHSRPWPPLERTHNVRALRLFGQPPRARRRAVPRAFDDRTMTCSVEHSSPTVHDHEHQVAFPLHSSRCSTSSPASPTPMSCDLAPATIAARVSLRLAKLVPCF